MSNKSAYCCPQLRAFVHLGRDERTTPWSLFASRSLPLWNRIGSEMFRPSSNDQGQARVKKMWDYALTQLGEVGVQIVRKLPRQIGRAPYQARFLGHVLPRGPACATEEVPPTTMVFSRAGSMRAATSSVRGICTSALRAQAPRPPRLIPGAHVMAGTPTPKDPIEVARLYPDHPLMRFFQRVPVEVPKAGTEGKHADERDTLYVPQAVTEADLGKDNSSRSWLAPELRRKSSADLHNLWYVLLMERNRLATSWEEIKRNNAEGAAHMLGESLSYRHHRVRCLFC